MARIAANMISLAVASGADGVPGLAQALLGAAFLGSSRGNGAVASTTKSYAKSASCATFATCAEQTSIKAPDACVNEADRA